MKHLSISWPSNNSETPPHFFEICLLPPTINWTKVRTDETCFWWNFLSGKVFSQRVIFGFFHSQGKKRRFFGWSGWCFFFAPNFVRWPLFIGSFGLVIQWSQTNSRVVEREAASYSSTVDLLVDFRDGHLNLGIRNKGLNFSISAYPSTFKSGCPS